MLFRCVCTTDQNKQAQIKASVFNICCQNFNLDFRVRSRPHQIHLSEAWVKRSRVSRASAVPEHPVNLLANAAGPHALSHNLRHRLSCDTETLLQPNPHGQVTTSAGGPLKCPSFHLSVTSVWFSSIPRWLHHRNVTENNSNVVLSLFMESFL